MIFLLVKLNALTERQINHGVSNPKRESNGMSCKILPKTTSPHTGRIPVGASARRKAPCAFFGSGADSSVCVTGWL